MASSQLHCGQRQPLAAAGMGDDLGPAGLYQRWSELLIVAAILTVCAWEENRSLI